MLIPDPRYLRSLLARYADLRISQARGEEGLEQALADIGYTLCVATGTRHLEDALEAADDFLTRTRTQTTESGVTEAAQTELAA